MALTRKCAVADGLPCQQKYSNGGIVTRPGFLVPLRHVNVQQLWYSVHSGPRDQCRPTHPRQSCAGSCTPLLVKQGLQCMKICSSCLRAVCRLFADSRWRGGGPGGGRARVRADLHRRGPVCAVRRRLDGRPEAHHGRW